VLCTRLGVLDFSKVLSVGDCFAYSKNLKTIDKLIVSANTQYSKNAFGECPNLENLTIEGTIGQSGLDLHWSTKLSKASIQSIIWALDLNSPDTAKTVTFSLTAVRAAFGDDVTEDGWGNEEFLNLVATARVCGWTINLV
jgi:hypothetical protein